MKSGIKTVLLLCLLFSLLVTPVRAQNNQIRCGVNSPDLSFRQNNLSEAYSSKDVYSLKDSWKLKFEEATLSFKSDPSPDSVDCSYSLYIDGEVVKARYLSNWSGNFWATFGRNDLKYGKHIANLKLFSADGNLFSEQTLNFEVAWMAKLVPIREWKQSNGLLDTKSYRGQSLNLDFKFVEPKQRVIEYRQRKINGSSGAIFSSWTRWKPMAISRAGFFRIHFLPKSSMQTQIRVPENWGGFYPNAYLRTVETTYTIESILGLEVRIGGKRKFRPGTETLFPVYVGSRWSGRCKSQIIHDPSSSQWENIEYEGVVRVVNGQGSIRMIWEDLPGEFSIEVLCIDESSKWEISGHRKFRGILSDH